MSTPLLELEDLHKEFPTPHGPLPVLRGLDLVVERGEFIAITGASGSGKSTLLTLLGCLDRPTRGIYRFEGREVGSLGDDEESRLRNRSVGFVFQAFNLIQPLNIMENVEVPLFYAGLGRAERRRLSRASLEAVGLAGRMTHRPAELSGGEQQRAAIARALVFDPPLILADEPTGNLDSATGAEIVALFEALHGRGKTVLLVTHDPGVAARAGRRIHMVDGTIREPGGSGSASGAGEGAGGGHA